MTKVRNCVEILSQLAKCLLRVYYGYEVCYIVFLFTSPSFKLKKKEIEFVTCYMFFDINFNTSKNRLLWKIIKMLIHRSP